MSAAASRIAVFGETLVDRFASGPVVGGAPFNVARHLAAFGHAPLMIGAVGADAEARLVEAEFDRYGLSRAGLQRLADRQTGVVDVHTLPGGAHRFEIRGDCAYDHIGGEAALAAVSALVPGGWLYHGTLALRAPVSRATCAALARTHAGPVFLDLNWREGHVSPGTVLQTVARADVLKVNDEELAMLSSWDGGAAVHAGDVREGETHAGIAALVRRFALDTLLLTCGAEGAMAFDRGGRCVARSRGTRPIALVDTVGAGDSFSAVMLAGQLRGWPLADALARATDFAGHVCEVRGAVPPDLGAYAAWTAHWPA